jgi:hypothetical protein
MKSTTLCIGLGLLLLVSFSVEPIKAKEAAVIKLNHRMAEDLVPIVQGFLSPEGKVAADPRNNSLIVFDKPEAIQQVRAYVDQFDVPLPQVRIRVRFDENRSTQGRSVKAAGKASGTHWSVASGKKKKDGIDVRIKDRHRTQSGLSEYSIITTSGSPSYILVGKDIPYRERWISISRHHVAVHETVQFKEIETGFEVTPVITGGSAHLKIVPRISDMDDKTGIIRFESAQTELTVPLGQWVAFGGSTRETHEVIQEIFAQGRGRHRAAMSMSLLVEKP